MTDADSTGRPKPVDAAKAKLYEDVETQLGASAGPGCGCGKNCDRSADDPCPVAAMPLWEVLFPGFDGGTDATDHLVKWVKAPSAFAVGRYLAAAYPAKALDCKVARHSVDDLGFGDGVDLVLGDDATVWMGKDLGDVDPPGGLWRLGDKYRSRRMDNLHLDVVARFLDPRPIGRAEWNELRLNGWERQLLLPRLDDETLAEAMTYSLKNCQPGSPYDPPVTYDRGIVEGYAPLLLKRFKAMLNARNGPAFVERGVVNPSDTLDCSITFRVQLDVIVGIALDPGARLSGKPLGRAILENTADYLKIVAEMDGHRPDILTAVEVVDAHGTSGLRERPATRLDVIPRDDG